ncbi:MAG: hypothetical protein OXG88_07470 [Gammaproteobacteria bacterium]|nr:hypothetical protein [Gammaproteobacteria bacterium]
MKKKPNSILSKGSITEEISYPRRSFLQHFALITGVFFTGVLRIKNVSAHDVEKLHTHEANCCRLWKPHDDSCDLNSCTSKLYWICVEDNVIYPCVECYDIDHGLTGSEKLGGCTRANLRDNVKCSKAVHPSDPDYTAF